ncbi:MAG: YeeE/YedE family protein [Planctomycetes bacterium]|nr:YeeE/YedE family protein [Planctomycetota bacterium]
MLASLFPLGFSHYLVGGLLIGAGIGLLFLATGRIGGASSVFTTSWSLASDRPYFQRDEFVRSRSWRLLYALGMVLGATVVAAASGATTATAIPCCQLLLGGLVAGIGARLGSGCTSGHGVCGMASLNPASFIAVATFLATAILTANALAWLGVR